MGLRLDRLPPYDDLGTQCEPFRCRGAFSATSQSCASSYYVIYLDNCLEHMIGAIQVKHASTCIGLSQIAFRS